MSTQTINGKIIRVDEPITKHEAQKLDSEARQLDDRMFRDDKRLGADQARLADVMDRMQIGYAKLGFSSFIEWAFDATPKCGLAKVLSKLGIPRYEFVGALSDAGHSGRDIAAGLRVTSKTADADIQKWKQEKLDKLRNYAADLTNSDDEPEDAVPEQVKPRPEARVSEGTTCAADSFEESYRYIREWVKPMLVNPEYQQARRFLKFLDKTRSQLAKYISEVEAEERRRGMHIVA
jgi:hypothetical protein